MTRTPADNLLDLASGIIGAVAQGEVQVLRVVQAEIAGLAKGAHVPATPEQVQADLAETEAGFDNMPV